MKRIKDFKYSKNLLKELVKTDFKLRYQGSFLGILWSVLKPLALFFVMYMVFVRFLKFTDGTPTYPIVLLLGISLWGFFNEATSVGMRAIVLFVVGMEEISWMQRIANVESSEFFLENNAQGETNFHNLATGIFERAYYFGAFLLLTVLPLLQKPLKRLLSKLRLRSLSVFIPSAWLVAPFAVTAGFIALSGLNSISYFLITVIPILILIYLIKNSKDNLLLPLLSLIIVFIGFTVFSFTDYTTVRGWAWSEYREFYIALGLAVYSVDVLFRVKLASKKS